MRLVVVVFLSLWLFVSIIYLIKPKWLWKFRMTLHRLGWFNKWSMFIPNKRNRELTIVLIYRDKEENDEVGDWKRLLEKNPHPLHFLFNQEIRIHHAISTCVNGLIREERKGKKDLDQDDHFLYLSQILRSYPRNKLAIARQVKLVYSDVDKEEQLIAESDFISIQ